MTRCRDDSLSYLNGIGYNVVRHPRSDLVPLSVLAREGGRSFDLGRLDSLVTEMGALPEVEADIASADLRDVQTSTLDFALGVAVVGSLLASMGGAPRVRSGFKNARTIRIEFSGILIDRIAPALIGKSLIGSTLDERNPVLEPYLYGDGDLFVVIETVKAREFSVVLEPRSGAELSVDTGEFGTPIGGSVTATKTSSGSARVSFSGPSYLVFGFKCLHLGVWNGRLALFSDKKSELLTYAGSPTEDPPVDESVLLVEGGLCTLR